MRHYSFKIISALTIFFLGVTIILISSFISFKFLARQVELRHSRESELILHQTDSYYSYLFDDAEKVVSHLIELQSKERGLGSSPDLLVDHAEFIRNAKYLISAEADGTFHISGKSPYPSQYDPREHPWYYESIERRGALIWSDPYLDYIDQHIVITLSGTHANSADEFPTVFAATFDVSQLSRGDVPFRLGKKGYVMLLSRGRQVVANRDNYLIGRRPLSAEELDELSAAPYKLEPLLIDDEVYLIEGSRLPSSGMYILVAVHRQEMQAEILATFFNILIWEILILLIFSLSFYILVRRAIKPLDILNSLMLEAEEGNYSIKADFTPFTEIRNLARNFNRMMKAIKNRDEVLRLREVRIKNLAYYDSLTGLPNRAYLLKSLNQATSRKNDPASEGALLYIDLDRFKIINDSMGHSIGDRVLKEAAKKIAHNLRHGQIAARIGGDEFVVHLEQVSSRKVAGQVAERLLKILNRPHQIDGNNYHTGASIGIVLYPEHGGNADVLLKKADMAMYHAKREGKNTFRIFEESLEQEVIERSRLERGIRNALKEGLLEVRYQPQYDLASGRLCSAEALLRCESRELEGISTLDLINCAEDTGLIIEIEKWLIAETARFAGRLNHALADPVRISINISPVHLSLDSFFDTVKEIIDRTGTDRRLLELEITETAMMNSLDLVSEKLNRLRSLGIAVHVDDFGTGYSSLSYLQRLPIDYIKIDKSFVDALEEDDRQRNIISLIIDISHNLNLRVIAEGIETARQHQLLLQMGCDFGQGYYLTPPIRGSELETLVTELD